VRLLTTPATHVTQAAFAAHIGVVKSRVTALKKQGKVVIDPATGLVDIAASMDRIAATAAAPERSAVVTPRFSESREERERVDLASSRLDLAERCRLLAPTAGLAAAAANAGAQFRARMETLADTLTPQVAPLNDEAQVRALLAEYAESVLAELAHAFAELTTVER
jgi:hypothetical protein